MHFDNKEKRLENASYQETANIINKIFGLEVTKEEIESSVLHSPAYAKFLRDRGDPKWRWF